MLELPTNLLIKTNKHGCEAHRKVQKHRVISSINKTQSRSSLRQGLCNYQYNGIQGVPLTVSVNLHGLRDPCLLLT